MDQFWQGFVAWWQQLGAYLHDWLLVPKDGQHMNLLMRFVVALIFLIVGRYLIKLVMKFIRRISGVKTQIGVDVSVKTFTLAVLNLLLNVGLAIFFLLILGVDLSSMAQVISAVTVAVGLALQDLISSFASGVILLRAKHFRTGDYIRIDHSNGSVEGTVSSVGLISATLETFENQHVVIPNNVVLQGVITNYSTNPTRRLTVEIDIDRSSDIGKVKEVMQEVVRKDKRILEVPKPITAIVNLKDYSMTMRLVCYTKLKDYWDVFYDIREVMLLAYRDNDISIPYQRVVVEQYQGSDASHQAKMLSIRQSEKEPM